MIDKETQRIAWSCLPKEFKEEVKRMYRIADSDVDQMIATIMLENVFGLHNLTSDAEGEEMLVVKAETVRNMYAANERIKVDFLDKETSEASDHINHVLRFLFGSKCLPDELNEDNFASKEPKPAEPTKAKYHKGEKSISTFIWISRNNRCSK